MMNQSQHNTRLSVACTGLRQLSTAVVTSIALLGSVQAATDEVVYFHTDALGSPVAAFSESGEVCWTETYSPYGEKLDKEDSLAPDEGCGLLGTDVGYTGHVQDSSGLVYAQQRYYDPQIGRFMSTDPVLPDMGGPKYFGRYQYAGNNPYRFVDPDGMAFGDPEADNETGGGWSNEDRGSWADHADSKYGEDRPNREDATGFSYANGGKASVGDDAVKAASAALAVGGVGKLGGWISGKFSGWLGKLFGTSISLTPAQAARVNTINNIITHHALPHDFAGVAKELRGRLGKHDHVQEMQNAAKGLSKALGGIKGSLSNPNLGSANRAALQDAYDRGQATLGRMTSALNGD